MTKRRLNLRKVVATAICLAGMIMFSGCDKDPNADDGEGLDVYLYINVYENSGEQPGFHNPEHYSEGNCQDLYWQLQLVGEDWNTHKQVEWDIEALGTHTVTHPAWGDYEVADDAAIVAKVKGWVQVNVTPSNYFTGWSTGISVDYKDYPEHLDFVWSIHGQEYPPPMTDNIKVTINTSKLSEIKQYIKYTGSESDVKINLKIIKGTDPE